MTKLKDKIVGYISSKQRKMNTLENKVSACIKVKEAQNE